MCKSVSVFLLFVFITAIGASCTNVKKSTYFYDLKDANETVLTSNYEDNTEHKIQNNELLSIRITSPTTEDKAYAIFNTTNSNAVSATTATGGRAESSGYLIDSEGNIEIPLLGRMKAAGLTKTQLREGIIRKLIDKKLLLDPIVDIRFLNYEVTVIGEVTRPTVITVPNEKISLIKALGVAGDITVFGRKDNVMLIRDTEGKKIVKRVDLNSSTFLQSPYYYLQPNDVVYVEATKNKEASVSRNRNLIPIILSSLSVMAIVLDRVTR